MRDQSAINELYKQAIDLLSTLISTPSFSREEDKTADILENFLQQQGVAAQRTGNNVWAICNYYDPAKPTLLLNSHHDTVKPNPAYSRNPFAPEINDGKLYGLGSNDAGGALVSLISSFLYFERQPNPNINLVLATSAEEEISGHHGIELVWPALPQIDFAIVGEPTLTDIAIAEKGLLVLDCIARGQAGHAAREEGVNAIYRAVDDIAWFRSYRFPKRSDTLGDIKISITVIHAGQAHNQVPPECNFTVDVRITDVYTLEEVLAVIRAHVQCEVQPRSLRLRPSGIATDHPLVKAAQQTGGKLYGSPTTSDQALIPVPSIKMGPGDSARSHAADEFIFIEEIRDGIDKYVQLISNL